MLVADVIRIMEAAAPPSLCAPWDNCGLQVGDAGATVSGILCTLDVTEDVLLEAVEKHCNLVISHHPVIFHPVRSCTADTAVGGLLRIAFKNEISLYSAHTNLDACSGGVNDMLCDMLGLAEVRTLNCEGEACGRIGLLPQAMTDKELAARIRAVTGCRSLAVVPSRKPLRMLALCTGAGEEYGFAALENGADAFLTGEISHHTALEFRRRGLAAFAAGHYGTEIHAAEGMKSILQKQLSVLQYNLPLYAAQTVTDPFEFQQEV